MKKILKLSLFLGAFLLAFNSCQRVEAPLPTASIVTSIDNNGSTPNGAPVTFTANINSTLSSNVRWILNGKEVSHDTKYIFTPLETGKQELILEVSSEVGINRFPFNFTVINSGTFLLNEGSMGYSNGFVSFIDRKGVITDSLYYKANNRPLGGSTQNMCITKDHIYFISQDTDKGDQLVMADSKTLKKQLAFNGLNKPTQVAAVDSQHVYIRDAGGVHLFNTATKVLSPITGIAPGANNQMVIINKSVFVITLKKVVKLEDGAVVKTIDMGAIVSGIVKSYDNNLWVAVLSTPNKIVKLNAISGEEIDSKPVTVGGVRASEWDNTAHTPGIGAYKNILYFNDGGTDVSRMDFTTGICTKVASCEDVSSYPDQWSKGGTAYNNVSVDPRNGDVYMHTIKGFGRKYLTNDIICWKSAGNGLVLKFDIKDHTKFPTGCYFKL